jgi:hypothetical protein
MSERPETTSPAHVALPPGLRLWEDFLPEALHDRLFALLASARAERNEGHDDGFEFDDVAGFDRAFSSALREIFSGMRAREVFPVRKGRPTTLGCTMVGYGVDDFIARHKDSYFLAGDTIATVSLGSPTVLEFFEDGTGRHVPVLIPPRSLYVMGGVVRTGWTHEIRPGLPTFAGQPVARTRRFALVFFEPGSRYDGERLRYA